MTDGSSVVECHQVARTFGHGAAAVVAVHGLTCVIRPGDLIALTGPSGSGKSTLVHLLAGIEEPTAGSIAWPALGDRHQLRPRQVSIVLQGPSLLAPLDVVQNVALPLLLAGHSDHEARARAAVAIDAVGLSALARRFPDELSAGQAQRVAVARALVGEPALILADEPTGQLDRVNARTVTDLLVATALRLGAALVVATHDDGVVGQFATRWVMADGRLEQAAQCSA